MQRCQNLLFFKQLESMRHLRELVRRVDWETGLKAWKEVFSFKCPIEHKPDDIPDVLGQPELSSRINKPKKGDNCGKKSRRQKRKERKEKRIEEKKQRNAQMIANSENCSEAVSLEQCKNVDDDQCTNCAELQEGNKETENEQLTLQSKELSERLENISSESADVSQKGAENCASMTDGNGEPVPKKVKLTEYRPDKPSFRVTCHRTGEGHSFDSMGAQSNFGGAIYNYFKWNVSMKEFDIEVMLYIDGTDVKVGLALTKQSLHRRNTTSFGPTTLRPTLAYNMLR